MITFLIDAQLSRKLVHYLSAQGYLATHVYDHLDPQTDDRDIAVFANTMGACIISKDSDFADLARRGQLDRPFVWLRLPNLSNEQLLKAVDRSLPGIISAIAANQRIVELHQDQP